MSDKDFIIYINGIKCKCNKTNITIYNSYKISENDIDEFLISLRTNIYDNRLFYNRSNDSWKKEILSHNILYLHNIYTDKTKDTDLAENEQWYRLILYNIIYTIHKIISFLRK